MSGAAGRRRRGEKAAAARPGGDDARSGASKRTRVLKVLCIDWGSRLGRQQQGAARATHAAGQHDE